LAALALVGSWHQSTRLLSILAVPVLVLAVPIFDTCFVTIQRLAHHQHPFHGGTDHVSHRLAILGLSERQTVLSLYVVSAGFGLLSLASRNLSLLSSVVLWGLALMGLVLVGAFLAKVRVYELKRQPVTEAAQPSPQSMTLVETMLLHKRRLMEILVDFGLISSAYVAAHLLRFEAALTPDIQRLLIRSLPLIIVIKLACFAALGLYRGVWRYVSLPDMLTIFKAVTLGSGLSALTLLYLWRFEGYSRAVFIIDWLLLFVGVSATRVAERFLNEWIVSAAEDATPILIVGAGDTGELALRHLKHNGEGKRRVVGFLDDDVRKRGMRIHGLPVLGTREALSRILSDFQVREVLIAISQPPAELVAEVQRSCQRAQVPCKILSATILER
jgi:UDP-GlcNAc:undecaprenyl-phosphate GlcNAc-1-phosphate transferase